MINGILVLCEQTRINQSDLIYWKVFLYCSRHRPKTATYQQRIGNTNAVTYNPASTHPNSIRSDYVSSSWSHSCVAICPAADAAPSSHHITVIVKTHKPTTWCAHVRELELHIVLSTTRRGRIHLAVVARAPTPNTDTLIDISGVCARTLVAIAPRRVSFGGRSFSRHSVSIGRFAKWTYARTRSHKPTANRRALPLTWPSRAVDCTQGLHKYTYKSGRSTTIDTHTHRRKILTMISRPLCFAIFAIVALICRTSAAEEVHQAATATGTSNKVTPPLPFSATTTEAPAIGAAGQLGDDDADR